MTKFFSIALLAFVLFGCNNPEPSTNKASKKQEVQKDVKLTFAETTEQRHQKELFLSHDSLIFDIQLFFGGNERLNGELALATNSTGGKISYKDGKFINYGLNGISHSEEINPKSARFAAYTWSYFALMPFKLNDPGTHWNEVALDFMDSKSAHQLTFGENIGDAPDDWYIVNTNENGLLYDAAYIVTANSSVSEAENDPHAIRYENYQDIEGVPMAHDWTFFAWNKQMGCTDTLGYATLSNIRFK